jgi:NAD(P)-dependent dehydrogenase (short-subunit alcohol dehydrogenase family)
MDHLSLSTVVSAAKSFLSKEAVLHGLINNAGIMATPFEMSKDGHEAQWQTNYLAHWVFTSHLLPLMLRTSRTLPAGSVRIVNLTSSGHYSAPKRGIALDDTALPKASGMTRYGQSKLANVLHAKTLNKLFGPSSPNSKAGEGEIWTAAVHPGFVKTQIGVHAELPVALKVVAGVFSVVGVRTDADRGSWTSVFCLASPDMKSEQSGTYFQRIAEAGWQSAKAKDMDLAAKLEEWTVEQMKKEGWVK